MCARFHPKLRFHFLTALRTLLPVGAVVTNLISECVTWHPIIIIIIIIIIVA